MPRHTAPTTSLSDEEFLRSIGGTPGHIEPIVEERPIETPPVQQQVVRPRPVESPPRIQPAPQSDDEFLRSIGGTPGHQVSAMAPEAVPTVPRPKEDIDERRSVGDVAKDIALGLIGKGATYAGTAAVGLGGLVTGAVAAPLKAIGLEEIPEFAAKVTGYDPRVAQQAISEVNRFITSKQSKQLQDSLADVEGAKGFWGTTKAYIRNPDAALDTVLSSLPFTISTMGAVRVVGGGMAAAHLAEKGLTAGTPAARAALTTFFKDPQVISTLTRVGAGAEAALTAGAAFGTAQAEGRTFGQAAIPAVVSGAVTSLISIGSSKLIPDVEVKAGVAGLSGEARRQGAISWAKEMFFDTFKEGVLEELPQSAQEKVWENIALGKYEFNAGQDGMFQGVGKEAAAGMVAGAAQGGGMSAFAQLQRRVTPTVPEITPSKRGLAVTPEQVERYRGKPIVGEIPEVPVTAATTEGRSTVPSDVPLPATTPIAGQDVSARKSRIIKGGIDLTTGEEIDPITGEPVVDITAELEAADVQAGLPADVRTTVQDTVGEVVVPPAAITPVVALAEPVPIVPIEAPITEAPIVAAPTIEAPVAPDVTPEITPVTPEVTPVAEAPTPVPTRPIEKMTKAELQTEAEGLGVTFTKKDTKAVLREKIGTARQEIEADEETRVVQENVEGIDIVKGSFIRPTGQRVTRAERATLLEQAENLSQAKEKLIADKRAAAQGDPARGGELLREEIKQIKALKVDAAFRKTRIQEASERMADSMGRKIVWIQPNRLVHGIFSPATPDTMYISTRTGKLSPVQVVMHEIKHSLDFEGATTTAAGDKVRSILNEFHGVVETAAGKTSAEFNAWRKQYKRDFGYVPDDLEAHSEYTSEIFQDAASRPEFYENLLDQNPTVYDKIIGAYRKIVQAVYKSRYGKTILDKALDRETIKTLLSASPKRMSGVESVDVYKAVAKVISEYSKLGAPKEAVKPAKKVPTRIVRVREASQSSQFDLSQRMIQKGVSEEKRIQTLFDTWVRMNGSVTDVSDVRMIGTDGRMVGGRGIEHADILGSQRDVDRAISMGMIRVRVPMDPTSESLGGWEQAQPLTDKQEKAINSLFKDFPGYLYIDAFQVGKVDESLGTRKRAGDIRVVPDSKVQTLSAAIDNIQRFYDGRAPRHVSKLASFLARRRDEAITDPGQYWKSEDPTRWQDFLRKIQNRHIDVDEVVFSIEAMMGPMDNELNLSKKRKQLLSMLTNAMNNTYHNEFKPVLNQMATYKETVESVGEYMIYRRVPEYNELIARRNPELEGPGSDIDTKDAEDWMEALDPQRRAKLEEIAEMLDNIRKNTHRLMVDFGLESQEMVDAWEKEHPSWVSFQRIGKDESGFNGDGAGSGVNVRGTMGKIAVGGRGRIDPTAAFASVFSVREKTLKRGYKTNVMGHSVYGAAIKYPNPEFWYAIKPGDANTPQGRAKLVDELGKLYGMTEADVLNMFDAPKESQYDRATKMVEYRTNPHLANKPYVLTTRVNGEDRHVVFNKGNKRAMEMVAALKNQTIEPMLGYFQIFGHATRIYAALSTQWNPLFGVKNLGRDTLEAMVTLSATPLKGHRQKVFKRIWPSVKANWRAERARRLGKSSRFFREEKQPEIIVVRNPDGTTTEMTIDELQREFAANGGPTGHLDYFADDPSRAKKLANDLKWIALQKETSVKAIAARMGSSIKGLVEDYNTAAENGTRLAAYATAREIGVDAIDAAVIAKQVTVNFNEKGNMTTNINSAFAFFNASVQGTATIARTMTERTKDGKHRISKNGWEVMAGGFVLGTLQYFILAMMGLDDRDDLPDFVKDKSFILPSPKKGTAVTIPMPLGFLFLPAMGRRALEMLYQDEESLSEGMVSMVEMALSAHNPLGDVRTGLDMIIPSVLKVPFQLYWNKDWKGLPIYREDFNSLNPTPGFTRARDTASGASMRIAQFLDRISGGDGITPGNISPNPDALDYLTSWTGGLGRETGKLMNFLSAVADGSYTELPMYKVPGASIYLTSTTGPSVDRQRFYDHLKEANEHYNHIKQGAMPRDKVLKYMEDNPNAKYARWVRAKKRHVDKLRKARITADKRGDELTADKYEDAMRSVIMEVNEKMSHE
jgi:hypothetical protein